MLIQSPTDVAYPQPAVKPPAAGVAGKLPILDPALRARTDAAHFEDLLAMVFDTEVATLWIHARGLFKQHCLYLRPLPHGQGSLRPIFRATAELGLANWACKRALVRAW